MKDVSREPDASDTSAPPGAVDPRVIIPHRLVNAADAGMIGTDWVVIGGGLVEVSAPCMTSDTRSSMEDYWRRRNVIVGDVQSFLSDLFGGRASGAPREDVVPVPPGWKCGPWRKDAPQKAPAGALNQGHAGWWRTCYPPKAPIAPAPPPAASPRVVVRPPRPQTPRPALPAPAPPLRALQLPRAPVGLQKRPGSGKPLPTKKPPAKKPAAPPKPTWKEIEADEAMAYLEQCMQLAVEISMMDPGARRALLVENPELPYLWHLFGWIELDEETRLIFETLAAELAEVGLSLFDFEAAVRTELPPALAKELAAAPLGLAELVEPAPMQSGVAAGTWDPRGVFLPAEPSVWDTGAEVWRPQSPNVPQRASYGYTPQAPRLEAQPTWGQQRAAEARAVGVETSEASRNEAERDATLIQGHGSCRRCEGQTTTPTIIGKGGGGEVIGDFHDPACCPDCALDNMGPRARAWVRGLADPSARVGDFWSDLGRGFATADRWLSDNVWENVKGVVPYGNVIDAAHQTRMRALEAAAPDFYPARATGAKGATGRAPARSTAGKGAAVSAPSRVERAITTASRLALGVKRGDRLTIASVKTMKDRAAAGDPEARRNWRVYVLVARDEHGPG